MNSGKEFEEKVADCYRKLGYDVKPNQKNFGFQIDLIIEKREGGIIYKNIVECKDKKQINSLDRNQIWRSRLRFKGNILLIVGLLFLLKVLHLIRRRLSMQ
jgi:hypothetical protein